MDDLFWNLPVELQNRIRPPHKPMPLQQAMYDKMEASIYPEKYQGKRAASAIAAESACGAADVPPFTNRGGKLKPSADSTLPSWESKEKLKIVSLGKKGKFQTVAIPKHDKSADVRHSFIDWVNFTFKVSTFPLSLNTGHFALSDIDYVYALSAELHKVFGYGVTRQRESGMNFYANSFDLGHNGWGIVCIGGQNDTCLVTVKGQGLMAAAPGWERRLLDLLKTISGSKLTRVDLASDNFQSETSMEDYLAMYHAGLFVNRGRAPNVEQAGNWIKPTGKGRTLYIGNRKSGKLLRIYEKGLQLANGFHEKYPDWVRVELELKNDDRVIPLEVLLRPGQYLAGAYPALANMHKLQDRIETFKNTAKSTFEKSVEVTRHQFGKHIWTQVQILGLEETFKRLTAGKEKIPAKLNFETFEEYQELEYIHTNPVRTQILEEIPI